jgi:hypothetical protein
VKETFYANTPIPARRPGRFYLWFALALLTFFLFQWSFQFFFGRSTRPGKPVFIEDPAHAVFKEEDIARGLSGFGRGAKDSYLARLKEKAGNSLASESGPKRERLGPVVIVKHEALKPLSLNSSFSIREPIGLPLGTKMPSLLKDKIFSFNVENQVEAELLKDIYYLGKLRLAKGTKFFGQVSVLHSEDRVNIRFTRLLLPWGEEREVRAVAHSLDGSGGIKGKVHKNYLKRFFSITGKTALGALTLLTVQNRQDAFSLDDELRLTAASNLSQEAQRELERLKVDRAITVEGMIPIQIVLLESV